MMPTSGNVKMAVEALRSSRWRSWLTILGIVIGIVSVITIVSLGEGVKRELSGQIDKLGPDIITIQPGRTLAGQDVASNINLLGPGNRGSLNERDLQAVSEADGVNDVLPFVYVAGSAVKDDLEYDSGPVIGTNQDLAQALDLTVEFGTFFSDSDGNQNGAVIGRRVAEELFKENVPVGKLFRIRGEIFVVKGVFEESETSRLAPNLDYNSTVFIPYNVGKALSGDDDIYQILARANGVNQVDQTAEAIEMALMKTHDGHSDFTVLTPEENLAQADEALNLLTAAITAIAGISLIVAGIGIMNIMLVSVTERTHEIGVRKAIGATSRQLLLQFLTESVILSLLGGVLGVIFALLTNFLIRIFTELTPVLTWPIVAVAVGVAAIVGVIFGVTPALQAARKHPIDALRHS